jgi:hypothetical protein
MKKFVPLKNAMLVWNSPQDRINPIGIQVVEHPETAGDLSTRFKCNSLASFYNWRGLSGKERMQCLLQEGWRLALDEHFPLKEIHKAFLRIKEYNDYWSEFGE